MIFFEYLKSKIKGVTDWIDEWSLALGKICLVLAWWLGQASALYYLLLPFTQKAWVAQEQSVEFSTAFAAGVLSLCIVFICIVTYSDYSKFKERRRRQ